MILVSSSIDLELCSTRLAASLGDWARARGAEIELFHWKEQTANGMLISAHHPVQVQIEAIMQGRITCTLVMFGERIGVPLKGQLPVLAQRLLEEWAADGLAHPWPEDPVQEDAWLSMGRFPLTGTVYELLAAQLSAIQAHDKVGRSGTVTCTAQIVHVAYLADRKVEPGVHEIKFNQGTLFKKEAPSGPEHEAERKHFVERIYRPQVQALQNLLKAWTGMRRGLPARRCDSDTALVEWLAATAKKTLQHLLPDRTERLPFKGSMEPYRVGDPLPLPDRVDKRDALKKALAECSINGQMLLLQGPSGCGKSSLLQKGLLDDLPPCFARAIVIVFRPEQLTARPEATPFLALLGLIADTLDAAELTRLGKIRTPPSAVASTMANEAAAALEQALVKADRCLVVGVDQFEELVDLVVFEERQRDVSGGWFQVVRLLSAIAKLGRTALAGTLELQRKSALQRLDLPQLTGLVLRFEDADFPIGAVRDFVRLTSRRAGLRLSISLVDAIVNMVERFDETRTQALGAHASASFLPLLGLWMHRFFALFQDRMSDEGGDGSSVTSAFQTSSREVTEADLRQRGISLEIAPLVGELVQAAWEEAGNFVARSDGRLRTVLVDPKALQKQLHSLLADPNMGPWIRTFIATDGTVQVQSLLAKATELGLALDGTKTEPNYTSAPDPMQMDNFFQGLLAVDHGRNLRLLDRPRDAVSKAIIDLILAFERRRLLVPSGANRVRLVHQAVVDHWQPAREWIEARSGQFERIRRIKHVADSLRYHSMETIVAGDPDIRLDVSRVLRAKREVWRSPQQQSDREHALRKACLDLLASAPDGSVVTHDGNIATSFVHEAARYNLVQPLDRWLEAEPGLVNRKLAPLEVTPLHNAAWSAFDAVRTLLKYKASIREPDADECHPIAYAISAGRDDIVNALKGAYLDCNEVVGPRLQTLTHIAAISPSVHVLMRLIDGAKRPLPCDSGLNSPLHYASYSGQTGHVRLLLPLCESSGRNQEGSMALHLAAMRNHGPVIEAILGHPELTATERDAMLLGKGVAAVPPWESPLVQAASHAQPSALEALLDHVDPADAIHCPDGRHSIVRVTAGNQIERGGAPLADRVSKCVALLLKDGRLTTQDAELARASAFDFPDALRVIDEWLLERGDMSALSADRLIDWLSGSRLEPALAVLDKSPGILDVVDSKGKRGAARLLADGLPRVIARALELGVEPSANAELFRLEAALVLRKRAYPIPEAPAKPLHPLVQQFADGGESEVQRLLIDMLPSSSVSWTLLHRLAIRGEKEAYADVMSGLLGPVPLDPFGRLPSQLASPLNQAAFESIESAYDQVGVST